MRAATAFSSLLALALLAIPAHAATYCDGTAFLVCDGCTTTNHIKVVVASAPREGRAKGKVWCNASNGGVARNVVLERPKIGRLFVNGYNVFYRGDRVGRDRFALERTWFQVPNNKWVTGKIIYEIEVVPAAF